MVSASSLMSTLCLYYNTTLSTTSTRANKQKKKTLINKNLFSLSILVLFYFFFSIEKRILYGRQVGPMGQGMGPEKMGKGAIRVGPIGVIFDQLKWDSSKKQR